jgi:hypothetical protein
VKDLARQELLSAAFGQKNAQEEFVTFTCTINPFCWFKSSKVKENLSDKMLS